MVAIIYMNSYHNSFNPLVRAFMLIAHMVKGMGGQKKPL
jgi:hypothetical protein